ncbi:uncharacterized protein LOC127094347 [Lathyrus oleraceus]|uniref:uncharacterized protein LOC127094347 n=1 Tax=Pisum sativum TaxID=3888 RepID=UPI0021CEBA45|nr:uncharacterized protein LOC127094347 [Pisum sativum]
MYVHLQLVEKNLWVSISEGPFIPKGDNNVVKHPKDWTDNETKQTSYDLKVRNILISSLSMKVFYSISHHKSTKGMWDPLQTHYEGMDDTKDSKINMFIEKFKLFHVDQENL